MARHTSFNIHHIPQYLLSHRQEVLVLSLIVLAAGFLRLYRLPTSMQFLGDQGRDALLVSRIFKQGDFVFIGPVTSIGNMYLGPLYYYFMLPWLWLSYPSPVGPAAAVAVMGIVTVLCMYLMGKDLVGKRAALIGAALLAVNAIAVVYSRFSWNPNLEPFFGLALAWCIYRALTRSVWYWLGVSVCLAVLTQLHYMALLAVFPAVIVWLYQLVAIWQQRNRGSSLLTQSTLRTFFLVTFISLALFLLSLAPLVLFDLKHQGTNLKALQDLLGGQNSISQYQGNGLMKVWSMIKEVHGRSLQVLTNTFIGSSWERNTGLLLLGLFLFGWTWWRQRGRIGFGVSILLLFVIVSILGSAVYSHSVFDHYLLYVLPLVALLFGWLLASLWRVHQLVGVAILVLLAAYTVNNVSRLSFTPAGKSVKELQAVAELVGSRLQVGELYNLVLLSESRDLYGQNYRYFFDTLPGKSPINPDHDSTVDVDTLLILNEEHATEDVRSLPIYEIQAFGPVQSEEVVQAPGNVTVTILRK